MLEVEVAYIHRNRETLSAAAKHGLAVQTISWEDSARNKNSCYGPNISDMTLRLSGGGSDLPMIRYPNFSDLSVDRPIGDFSLTVGNEGSDLPSQKVSLRDYLQNLGNYVKRTSGGEVKSLFSEEKDSHVLTSAQYCILPLDEKTVEFNVSLNNYQSSSAYPAVLVIVSSQKGTSAQTVYGGCTQLYFNDKGQAANYVAERLKEERRRLGKDIESKISADETERNCLYIFQVPLKVPAQSRGIKECCLSLGSNSFTEECCPMGSEGLECESFDGLEDEDCEEVDGLEFSLAKSKGSRGMDHAMLSVGKSHSKFEGIKDHPIERDHRFPIRCTIQKYLCTDTAVIPDQRWVEMKENIDRLMKDPSSLVSGKTERPTEW